jgi:hypothetical protein
MKRNAELANFRFWSSRPEELVDFRNRLRQEYAVLEETSRLLRKESKWLIEESRRLRRKLLVFHPSEPEAPTSS